MYVCVCVTGIDVASVSKIFEFFQQCGIFCLPFYYIM